MLYQNMTYFHNVASRAKSEALGQISEPAIVPIFNVSVTEGLSCEMSLKQAKTTSFPLRNILLYLYRKILGLPLWFEFLATDPEVRILFLALPDFLRSSESGKVPTQPRENLGAT
jgi:hypothetical protein